MTPIAALRRAFYDIPEPFEPRHGLRKRRRGEPHVTRERRERRRPPAIEVHEQLGIAGREPVILRATALVTGMAGEVDLGIRELNLFDGIGKGHKTSGVVSAEEGIRKRLPRSLHSSHEIVFRQNETSRDLRPGL